MQWRRVEAAALVGQRSPFGRRRRHCLIRLRALPLHGMQMLVRERAGLARAHAGRPQRRRARQECPSPFLTSLAISGENRHDQLVLVVMYGGREVAIEVDGPLHFCGRTPTGPTALIKRRQLRAAGRVLLPVPYWEWDALGSNAAAKQEYLRAALQQLLPGVEAHALAAAQKSSW